MIEKNKNFYLLLSKLIVLTILYSTCEYTLAGGGDHHGDHSAHPKNALGIFIGSLKEPKGGTESVYGLEYEYKFSDNWGAGFVYEQAPDAHKGDGVTATIVQAFWHPYKGWRLGLGFGKEKVGDHDGKKGATENLTRIGVGYDFHLKNYFIAPSVNIDKVNGENINVYGVAFGIVF